MTGNDILFLVLRVDLFHPSNTCSKGSRYDSACLLRRWKINMTLRRRSPMDMPFKKPSPPSDKNVYCLIIKLELSTSIPRINRVRFVLLNCCSLIGFDLVFANLRMIFFPVRQAKPR